MAQMEANIEGDNQEPFSNDAFLVTLKLWNVMSACRTNQMVQTGKGRS